MLSNFGKKRFINFSLHLPLNKAGIEMTDILLLPNSIIMRIISERKFEYLDRGDLRRHAGHQLLNQQMDSITSLLQERAFEFEILPKSKEIKVFIY